MKKRKLTIEICHDYTALPCPRQLLNEAAGAISLHEKNISRKTVALILCSDYKIRALNSRYRKIDKPTDVLSFPFNDDDLLGEIYISLQRAKVQSRRFKSSYNREIKRLFVHGMLHLLGYDHHTQKDREIMEAREREYE